MTACAVCGKPITYRFSLCRECEALYGRRAAEWPGWVRAMVNSDRRERRFWERVGQHEVSVAVLIDAEPGGEDE